MDDPDTTLPPNPDQVEPPEAQTPESSVKIYRPDVVMYGSVIRYAGCGGDRQQPCLMVYSDGFSSRQSMSVCKRGYNLGGIACLVLESECRGMAMAGHCMFLEDFIMIES